MAHYDLIIRGATVIDGTRAPRYDADIAVKDGRIAAIGRLEGEAAEVDIDGSGRIAAPGFIDSHTHDDRLMLSAPEMTAKVSQGVTTVIAGNCGISLAPAPNAMRSPVTPPLDIVDDEGSWFRFRTFAEYVEALAGATAESNCALLVGHTMLRVQTMDN
jgi:N-acyl-D-amino-acid deacylase